jgi:hypothetical protein
MGIVQYLIFLQPFNKVPELIAIEDLPSKCWVS